MSVFDQIGIPAGRGICYSGFREGQQPGGVYPGYEEVREDLFLLKAHWKYLRLFDCDLHAETVLEVIRKEGLDFRCMLGAYINAEMNNFSCPWNGGVYSEEQLDQNGKDNQRKIQRLAEMAREYADIVFAVSVGNEATVEWTDHYVPEKKVQEYVRQVREAIDQPVTFCENYVPWLVKLETLAREVDFISIHTYPVWEYRHIHEAMDYTRENYMAVAGKYPDIPVVITEAGWATRSNGRGIDPDNVNEAYQTEYFERLMEWSEKEQVPVFFFEAFDESWKGSPEPLEPEKHWGLFHTDRTPKQCARQLIENNKRLLKGAGPTSNTHYSS